MFPLPIVRHPWKVKQPYAPNIAGTVAAIAALKARAWLDAHVRAIVSERERMAAVLRVLAL